MLETQRACSVNRRQLQHRFSRHNQGIKRNSFVNKSSQLHLTDHVVVNVALGPPSQPRATLTPLASICGTLQTPEASLLFEEGLCETLVRVAASFSMSSWVSHTICTSTDFGPRSPTLSA